MNNAAMTNPEQKSGGIMDMGGSMSGEMAARLNDMKLKLSMVQTFMKEIMDEGFDYGIIPGTDKPCLFKSGAEKMIAVYGFSSVVKEKKETRDLITGYYLAEITMQIIHRGTGAIVAEGVGECSSFESKYRYRWSFENELPRGTDKTGLVSKTWLAFKNGQPVMKDGVQVEYTKYRMDNSDLIDQWNTVLKMAKKRALVDATLTATGTSGIFTQTADEMDDWMGKEDDGRLQKLKKQKPGPTAADEKHTFAPTAGSGMITGAQKNKIQYDADKRGVKAEQIDAIVKSTKGKGIDHLTKTEASAVIDWLGKVTKDELNDLVIDVEMDGAAK